MQGEGPSLVIRGKGGDGVGVVGTEGSGRGKRQDEGWVPRLPGCGGGRWRWEACLTGRGSFLADTGGRSAPCLTV